ncbi:tRNA (adenosine(37)-N6)-dimethylallyltransferase MiaA [Paucilactobacillus kaifaensis]|uniref:tRNA (adenosine(37)-N6)-dimethylallyltransferase MiaA n=1 Tax=Paucilactobacillus kaifaensis TaxID=2559921 RepID=UPI0010F917E2|nr:tRNA (adenosine(37)-N6)-dimethylallyltransferase MiaA [Paucilactobacillus kaifaensis]
MVKVIAIVGPTAVGKTELSLQLAQDLNAEVISGDSMQVYRHLNIGTAKIMPDEMRNIPHHLIDIRDVNQRFSVADFQTLAKQQIASISSRQRLPLVVGGTGFYLQSLTENLTLGNDQFDDESRRFRQQLQQYYADFGADKLWQRLNKIDSTAAASIPPQNIRRVIRAIEVTERSGVQFSQQYQEKSEFEFKLIGLTTDRKILYERINHRVDEMISAGLEQEARWLYTQNGTEFQAGKGIGYREFFKYFTKQQSLEETIAEIKQDSRHYAKRQLTWFRNKMDVEWFDLVTRKDSINEIENVCLHWLQE